MAAHASSKKPLLQLLSKKLIKPISPTPSSLKSYKISKMDQLTTDDYVPIISFYPNYRNNYYNNNSSNGTTQTAQLLENSLSKILKSYYPFAGTMPDNVAIDCNDRGAMLHEARINCTMSDILNEPDVSFQTILYPKIPWSHSEREDLTHAQLNHFDCGGKALTVCVTHKFGDAYTMTSFVKDWAALARSGIEPSPDFTGASIFPPLDTSITPVFEPPRQDHVAKRFSFDGKTIGQLKQLVTGDAGVQNPTRVEVMTAFTYKSAITAAMVNRQSFTPSVLLLYVNLRRLTDPPLSKTSVGNNYLFFPVSITEEKDLKISRLVSKIRKGKVEFYKKIKQMKVDKIPSLGIEIFEDQIKNVMNGMDLYNCSSVCGFPGHEFDFGWGRPIRVAIGPLPTNNSFILSDDNNGDGVDALVHLNDEVMSIFECDKDVLQFASSN